MAEAMAAARLGDPVGHSLGVAGMIAGAVAGALIGAALLGATVLTGGVAGVAAAAVIAGMVGGGALAGGQLVKGLTTVLGLSHPTTGMLARGSPNVRVNGKPAVRAKLDFVDKCTGLYGLQHMPKPSARVAEGSATVRVNGQPAARVKNRLECAAEITKGSPNVVIGGPTEAALPVAATNEDVATQVAQVLVVVGLAGAVGLAVVGAATVGGALLGLGKLGLGMGAGYGLNEGLGWVGDQLGPGYRDLLQGGFGMGAMLAGPRAQQAAQRRAQLRTQRATQQQSMANRVRANIAESQRARAASNFGKPLINPPPRGAIGTPGGQNVIRRIPLRGVRPAGQPAAGNVNYMKPGDPFRLNAGNRPDVNPNGRFDFMAHGTPSKVQIVRPNGEEVWVNHRVAARLIQQNPAYQRGQPVRLLSCSTGEGSGSFAQNLSNKLGVPVRAPSDVLWAWPNGAMRVSGMRTVVNPVTGATVRQPVWPPNGSWRDFTPGGRSPRAPGARAV